jgi:hypothetical protein
MINLHGRAPLQPDDDPVRGDAGLFELVEAHHQPKEWRISAGDVAGTAPYMPAHDEAKTVGATHDSAY